MVTAHDGKRAPEDAQRSKFVDGDNKPIDSVLDGGGVRRFAMDMQFTPHSHVNKTLNFQTPGAPYVSKTTASYAVFGTFIFEGTTLAGTIAKIKAIASESGAGTASVRIFDVTNGLQVCEVTGISGTTLSRYDLGAISNLPTGEAIFEVQGKQSAGNNVRISAVSIGDL